MMAADPNETSPPKPAEHRPVDEHANLITHALGLALSVIASGVLMMLVVNNQRTINIIACGIYSGTLIGLYAASTLSHMFHDLAWRRFFRTLDQACIFLLIAGSFTPIAVVFLWEGWWRTLLIVMWVFAIFGVFLVLRMRNLTPAAKVSYGVMGWLPIVSLKTLYEAAPFDVFTLILAGGLFYSVGSLFLRADHIRYFHALWHTFVIVGSVCHYFAILLVVM
jgi:hemolysin III